MLRILIAETSTTFTNALIKALSSEYEIHTAVSGAEAITLLEDLRPDVLLISLQLPPTNGLEVLRAVKGKPPVIIALTVVATESILEELSRIGVDSVIMRPCTISFVAKALDDLRKKSPTLGD